MLIFLCDCQIPKCDSDSNWSLTPADQVELTIGHQLAPAPVMQILSACVDSLCSIIRPSTELAPAAQAGV